MTFLDLKRGCAPLSFTAALLLSSAAPAETALPDGCAELLDGQRITIVVPNAAGGGYDLYARAMAPVLSEITGASALVSNMPGGSGKPAIVRVATAPSSELVLYFDSASDTVATLVSDSSLGPAVADFEVMGVVYSDTEVWLGRADIDLADPTVTRIVGAVSTIESNLVPVGLTARALGIEARLVGGYEGSSDNLAAILRGETDFTSLSFTTALRATETNDVGMLMLLDDKPHPDRPGLPWLAGEGGIVAKRAISLPAEEQARRQEMAALVVALASDPRTVFAPATMDPAVKSCTKAAVEATIVSEAFVEGAAAVKRPVKPIVGAEAVAAVAAIEAAYKAVLPMLDGLAQDLQGE